MTMPETSIGTGPTAPAGRERRESLMRSMLSDIAELSSSSVLSSSYGTSFGPSRLGSSSGGRRLSSDITVAEPSPPSLHVSSSEGSFGLSGLESPPGSGPCRRSRSGPRPAGRAGGGRSPSRHGSGPGAPGGIDRGKRPSGQAGFGRRPARRGATAGPSDAGKRRRVDHAKGRLLDATVRDGDSTNSADSYQFSMYGRAARPARQMPCPLDEGRHSLVGSGVQTSERSGGSDAFPKWDRRAGGDRRPPGESRVQTSERSGGSEAYPTWDRFGTSARKKADMRDALKGRPAGGRGALTMTPRLVGGRVALTPRQARSSGLGAGGGTGPAGGRGENGRTAPGGGRGEHRRGEPAPENRQRDIAPRAPGPRSFHPGCDERCPSSGRRGTAPPPGRTDLYLLLSLASAVALSSSGGGGGGSVAVPAGLSAAWSLALWAGLRHPRTRGALVGRRGFDAPCAGAWEACAEGISARCLCLVWTAAACVLFSGAGGTATVGTAAGSPNLYLSTWAATGLSWWTAADAAASAPPSGGRRSDGKGGAARRSTSGFVGLRRGIGRNFVLLAGSSAALLASSAQLLSGPACSAPDDGGTLCSRAGTSAVLAACSFLGSVGALTSSGLRAQRLRGGGRWLPPDDRDVFPPLRPLASVLRRAAGGDGDGDALPAVLSLALVVLHACDAAVATPGPAAAGGSDAAGMNLYLTAWTCLVLSVGLALGHLSLYADAGADVPEGEERETKERKGQRGARGLDASRHSWRSRGSGGTALTDDETCATSVGGRPGGPEAGGRPAPPRRARYEEEHEQPRYDEESPPTPSGGSSDGSLASLVLDDDSSADWTVYTAAARSPGRSPGDSPGRHLGRRPAGGGGRTRGRAADEPSGAVCRGGLIRDGPCGSSPVESRAMTLDTLPSDAGRARRGIGSDGAAREDRGAAGPGPRTPAPGDGARERPGEPGGADPRAQRRPERPGGRSPRRDPPSRRTRSKSGGRRRPPPPPPLPFPPPPPRRGGPREPPASRKRPGGRPPKKRARGKSDGPARDKPAPPEGAGQVPSAKGAPKPPKESTTEPQSNTDDAPAAEPAESRRDPPRSDSDSPPTSRSCDPDSISCIDRSGRSQSTAGTFRPERIAPRPRLRPALRRGSSQQWTAAADLQREEDELLGARERGTGRDERRSRRDSLFSDPNVADVPGGGDGGPPSSAGPGDDGGAGDGCPPAPVDAVDAPTASGPDWSERSGLTMEDLISLIPDPSVRDAMRDAVAGRYVGASTGPVESGPSSPGQSSAASGAAARGAMGDAVAGRYAGASAGPVESGPSSPGRSSAASSGGVDDPDPSPGGTCRSHDASSGDCGTRGAVPDVADERVRDALEMVRSLHQLHFAEAGASALWTHDPPPAGGTVAREEEPPDFTESTYELVESMLDVERARRLRRNLRRPADSHSVASTLTGASHSVSSRRSDASDSVNDGPTRVDGSAVGAAVRSAEANGARAATAVEAAAPRGGRGRGGGSLRDSGSTESPSSLVASILDAHMDMCTVADDGARLGREEIGAVFREKLGVDTSDEEVDEMLLEMGAGQDGVDEVTLNKWIRENFMSSGMSLTSDESRRTQSVPLECASDSPSMARNSSDKISSHGGNSRSLQTVHAGRLKSRAGPRVQAAIHGAEDGLDGVEVHSEGTQQEAVYVMDAIQFALEAKKGSVYKQPPCKENVPLAQNNFANKSQISMWSNFSDSNESESIVGRVYEA